MYKGASDNHQRALHHGRLADWMHGEEVQTGEQKLRSLKDGVQILDDRIQRTPIGDERKRLGLQKLEMQTEITALRGSLNIIKQAKQGWDQIFVDMAKEILTKSQFEIIWATANRRWKLLQADAAKQRDAVLAQNGHDSLMADDPCLTRSPGLESEPA